MIAGGEGGEEPNKIRAKKCGLLLIYSIYGKNPPPPLYLMLTCFYNEDDKKAFILTILGVQASTYEEPPDDNLYLGIVLTAVVVVTGTKYDQ